MSALLEAELIKLRTTRTFVALTAIAVATSLVITTLVVLLSDEDSFTKESVLTDVFTADTSSLFILVLAIVGISGEWRHRTITSSILAAPDRVRFLAAKTLAFGAAGLVLSLAISVSIAILGMVLLEANDFPTPDVGELIGQIGRNAAVAALLGAFGVGIGGLVRNQIAAIVGVLLIYFVLEGLLVSLAPDVGRFTPFTALPLSIQDIPPEDVGLDEDLDLLPAGLAALAMLAWIGAFFAAAAALLRARDLD